MKRELPYISNNTEREDSDDGYTGQVVLFPTTNVSVSTSFGMVVIKKKGTEGTIWKHISIFPDVAVTLSTSVADTLCRAMGYTNAVLNSAWTKGKYEEMGYQFYGDVNNAYVEMDNDYPNHPTIATSLACHPLPVCCAGRVW